MGTLIPAISLILCGTSFLLYIDAFFSSGGYNEYQNRNTRPEVIFVDSDAPTDVTINFSDQMLQTPSGVRLLSLSAERLLWAAEPVIMNGFLIDWFFSRNIVNIDSVNNKLIFKLPNDPRLSGKNLRFSFITGNFSFVVTDQKNFARRENEIKDEENNLEEERYMYRWGSIVALFVAIIGAFLPG